MERLEAGIGKIVVGRSNIENCARIFRQTLRRSGCGLGEPLETCDKAESEHKL